MKPEIALHWGKGKTTPPDFGRSTKRECGWLLVGTGTKAIRTTTQ